MLKLTHKERKILSLLEFEPDLTTKELAKKLGHKSTSIAYLLRKLKDSEIIKKTAVINFCRLGYSNIAMFVSFRSVSKEEKVKLINELKANPRIAWIGSFVGEYHFGIAYLARDLTEVTFFLRNLSEKFDHIFTQKIIAPRTSWSKFKRQYFVSEQGSGDFITLQDSSENIVVDELDHNILYILANENYDSIRDVARLVGKPFSTIERRIDRLKEKGVIAKIFYSISDEALRPEFHRLLISTDSISNKIRKNLFNYAKSSTSTIYFVESLGSWDFELGIEVEAPEKVLSICQELHDICDGRLQRIQPLMEVDDYKFSFYPFKENPCHNH
ncbi:MAG: Lrp/AsnC family transcriptional regulator [Bdellovibrionota bacterium]